MDNIKKIIKEEETEEISESLYMGQRIQMIRTNCAIERKKMAQTLNVSEVSLYKFETTGIIRGNTLRKYLNVLYQLLNINPAYIIIENNENINPFVGNEKELKELSPTYFANISLNKKVEDLERELRKVKNQNKIMQ